MDEIRVYTEENLEQAVSRAFSAGVSYGGALAICRDNHSDEVIMNVARYLHTSGIYLNQ